MNHNDNYNICFKADGRVDTNTTRTTATAVVSERVGIQNDS